MNLSKIKTDWMYSIPIWVFILTPLLVIIFIPKKSKERISKDNHQNTIDKNRYDSLSKIYESLDSQLIDIRNEMNEIYPQGDNDN